MAAVRATVQPRHDLFLGGGQLAQGIAAQFASAGPVRLSRLVFVVDFTNQLDRLVGGDRDFTAIGEFQGCHTVLFLGFDLAETGPARIGGDPVHQCGNVGINR